MFKTNYSAPEKTSALIPEGWFEIIVKNANMSILPSGNEIFNISYTIRNDLGQAQGNRFISDSIFDLSNVDMLAYKLNLISRALGIDEGMEYDNIADWGEYIEGQVMKVKIKHNTSKKNGKTYANVCQYDLTDYPECNHEWQDKPKVEAPARPITANFEPAEDDEVPF